MSTLRQRNRERTMEQVITAALGLFEERGYGAVKVSDIAARAEVSESTFYRLFQVKEGVFATSPWEAAPELTATTIGGVAAELRPALTRHSWRGIRWVMEEPEVRASVLSALDAAAQQLADHLAVHGTPRTVSAVQARTFLFGAYLTALEAWYTDGQHGPFSAYYDQALSDAALT